MRKRRDAAVVERAERAPLAGTHHLPFGEPATGGRLGPGWRRLRSPLPAYAIAVLLAYPALVSFDEARRLQSRIRELESPSLLAAPIALPWRSQRSGPALPSRAATPGGTVLTFFIPIADPYRYELEVRDATGRIHFADREAEPFDRLGTFALFFPAGSLPAGEYRIVLREDDPRTGQSLQSFSFAFAVDAPAESEEPPGPSLH